MLTTCLIVAFAASIAAARPLDFLGLQSKHHMGKDLLEQLNQTPLPEGAQLLTEPFTLPISLDAFRG